LEQPGAGAASAYPGISIVMHFAQPIAPAAGLEALLPEGTQGRDFPPRQYGEGVLYDLSGISPQPEVRFFLWFPDDRTAVMIKGDQALVDDVLDGQPAEGPLAKRLARLDLADREAAAVVTLENKSAEPIVSLLQQIPESVLQGLLQNTRAAHFTLDFDSPEGSRFLEGRIEAKGEKESIALNEYLNGLVASGQFGLASFESQMEGAPQEALRGIQLAKTLLNQVKLAPVASGVRLSLVKPPGFHSRFVAFLHDRTKAAEQTARIALQHAHLKQLVLAMYVYSENHGALPPWAIASEQGRPLLSWRVALLPYLRQQDLYDRFHLDEPWDSPHNRQLIDRMPAVFESYAPNGSSGTTRYRLFVSEQTPFGRGESLKVTDIVDAAQTVMIAAVSPRHATVWTRPDPLPFRPGESLGYFDEQMALAMFDGQIFSQMSATTPFSQEQLDTMITGNVVSHGEAVAPRNPFPTQPPAGSTLPSDAPSIGTPSQSSQATSSEREGSLRRAAPPSPTAGNPFRNRATSRPQ
jgi:hypothetical protein